MHRVLLVGSNLEKELKQWLENEKVHEIIVLEPHPLQAQLLRERYAYKKKLKIIEVALGKSASIQQLVEYSLPGFSSLSLASGLKRLFPGIQVIESYPVQVLSVDELVNQYGPKETETVTLVLRATGYEYDLIQRLVQSPQRFGLTDVILHAGVEPLYADSAESKKLVALLTENGYELVQQDSHQPEWVRSELRRNQSLDQIAFLQKELKQSQEVYLEQSTLLEQTQKKLQDHETWLRNRKKQVEELELELKREKEKNQLLQAEKNTLTQMESRLEQLFVQQTGYIQQATNALGKHITQSFVDQREHEQAVTGLYQYLEKGEMPLKLDGWAMSADTLSHLVGMIEQNSYDVIIEFGSGTSTVVMAQTIANRLRDNHAKKISQKQLVHETIETAQLKELSGSQASSLLDTANYDLPRQIISFEQDRKYFEQTQHALQSRGLSNVVELVLAPLVPAAYSDQTTEAKPLFYDCEKQIERLARLYEQRTARILVIVDGPYSPQQLPLVREPALGVILQYLSAHQLDILLDDTDRDGEQQVRKHWETLCQERGLSWAIGELEVLKGATWIEVQSA